MKNINYYESMERYLKNLKGKEKEELSEKQTRYQRGKMSQEEYEDLTVYEKHLIKYMTDCVKSEIGE